MCKFQHKCETVYRKISMTSLFIFGFLVELYFLWEDIHFLVMHLEFLEPFWSIVRLRASLCMPKNDSKFVGYILDKSLDFIGFSQTSWHLKNIFLHKLYWYFYQLFIQIVFSTFWIWQLSQNISCILCLLPLEQRVGILRMVFRRHFWLLSHQFSFRRADGSVNHFSQISVDMCFFLPLCVNGHAYFIYI